MSVRQYLSRPGVPWLGAATGHVSPPRESADSRWPLAG